MDVRYLKRENENGQEERFYPVAHINGIVYENDITFSDVEAHLSDTNNPHNIDEKINEALANFTGGGNADNPVNISAINELTAVDANGIVDVAGTSINAQVLVDDMARRILDLETVASALASI